MNLKPSGSWFRAMQTLSIRPLPREYTSTSQSWRNPLFVVLIPRYRPDVSGFLWHTAEAINWIKLYSPMQAGLFTTSSLLPDIIKQNESPKVTSATIMQTRETCKLFCGLIKQPTFRNATTHSVFPAKCRLKKGAQKFHTGDVSPPRSGKCFLLVEANSLARRTTRSSTQIWRVKGH